MLEELLAGASGVLFGIALDKGKVNEPYVVIQQMEMRNMTMLRMFLSALATSTAASATLNRDISKILPLMEVLRNRDHGSVESTIGRSSGRDDLRYWPSTFTWGT